MIKYFNSLDISNIPSNRIVRIETMGGKVVATNTKGVEVPLIYEDDFAIKAKSSFGAIGDPKSNSLLSILSNVSGGKVPSGQYALQQVQIWQNTDPLEFDFNVKIYMNDSAYGDVVYPINKLMQTCLPRIADNGIGRKLGALIPPGASLAQMLALSDTDAVGTANDVATEGTLYRITVGKFKIDNCVITGVEPTFTNSVDQMGYPVSADVTITARTTMICTKNMVSSIFGVY